MPTARDLAVFLFVAATCCIAAPAHADPAAYGFITADLRELQMLHSDGTRFGASDFSSLTHDYRATTRITSGSGRTLERTAGPSLLPVDLAQSCLGPTCPDRVENDFDGWDQRPLVFSYADQQMSAPVAGQQDGYRIRERTEAASIDGIGGPWGTWQSNASSTLSIAFRPMSSEAMTVSFVGAAESRGWRGYTDPNFMEGTVTTTVEIVHVGSGERWQWTPRVLNVAVDEFPNWDQEYYVLRTDVLNANDLYQLNVTMTSAMLASAGPIPPPVPEPAGWLLYATGLVALSRYRRRRHQT